MTQPPEPITPDPGITTVLHRLDVPEHRPGFWDDLARDLAEPPAPAAPPALPALIEAAPGHRSRRSRRRLVLLAAAVAVAVAATAALVRGGIDNARIQTVDSGPPPSVSVTVPGPNPTSTVTPPPDGSRSVSARAVTADDLVGPSAAGWFFSDTVTWSDDGFVAVPPDQSGYWTSPDGITWGRHDGSTAALVEPFTCPDGFSCDVSPAAEPIPFHFATPAWRVVARAGDLVVLDAWTQYTNEQEPTGPGDVAPGPALHPDILAAAAATDPCFEELRQEAEAGVAPGAGAGEARLASWSGGGIDDPVIRLSCGGPSRSASFALDLRDHLTPDQIRAVYSANATERWLARPGEPPVRVDDPPTATTRAGGIAVNELVTGLAPVVSSGSRLWAVDEGILVSSPDGVTWVPQAVPTSGQKVGEVQASPGGHLALRLADDPALPPNTASFVVSHDDGATWSARAVATGRLGVGPSGALVVDDSGEQPTATLLDGGRVRADITLAPGTYVRGATVGDGRILLQTAGPPSPASVSPEADTMLVEVYDADGRLLRQLVYDEGATGRRLLLPEVALLAAVVTAAAVGIAVVARRRYRAGRNRARD